MQRTCARGLLLALAGAALALPVKAVNKCTGQDGKVKYQDAPCEAHNASAQAVKVWPNSNETFYAAPRRRGGSAAPEVLPNLSLEGPPQARGLLLLYRRWADGERLALATGRIALSAPVATLQAVQREAEALQVHRCVSDAQRHLVALTSTSVSTLIQFMGKDELTGVVYQFIDRPTLIAAFERSVVSANCG